MGTVDWQGLFNFLVPLIGAAFSYIIYELRGDVKDLEKKLGAMEVLVAGNYLTRSEHKAGQDAIFEMLRGIRLEQRETNGELFNKLTEIAKDVHQLKGNHH